MIRALSLLIFLAASVGDVRAQSTAAPVVVPAATTASGGVTRTAVAAGADPSVAIMKQLQDMKAANEETIRKQEATLQGLDEVIKNAEQLRVFSKRN